MKTIAMTTVQGWGPFPDFVRAMAGNRVLNRILMRHDLPLSVLDATQDRIPLVKMVRVFEAAAREIGDYSFGRRIGEGTSVGDYGDWGAYSAGARDLSEGLHRVCSTIWAHESGSRMFLSEREGHVVWCYATGFETVEASRQFSDHLLKPMLDFVRAFLGAHWEPDWLEVGYARPTRGCDPGHGLELPIFHERPAFGLPIRRSDLSAPIHASAALPRPVTSVDLFRHRPRRSDSPLSAVLEAVDLCLLAGATDIGTTARLLDLGPRTLQRRLAEHGATFRDILHAARKRRALALLRETDQPIKEIARDLGYDESENFTRAFRGWQGVSPSAFRAFERRGGDIAPEASEPIVAK